MQNTNEENLDASHRARPKTALDAIVSLIAGLLAYFLVIAAATGMVKMTWHVMRLTWEYLP